MPSNYDDEDTISPMTMRGRDWPCLRQFCVFMENRVGRLHDLLKLIEQHDLHIKALSVVDSVDFAVARMIVTDNDRVREILNLSPFTFMENDILGVELPEETDPYGSIFRSLVGAEINIAYTYPLLLRRARNGGIVLYVDNIDTARQVLLEKGHHVLTENELLSDEFY